MALSEIPDLVARAGALLIRAQDLANAFRPSRNDQVSVIVMAVTDAHALLRQILAGESNARPSAVSATLNAESAKLDVLERLLLHRCNGEA